MSQVKVLWISSLLSYGNKKDNNILFTIAEKINKTWKVHIDMLFPNPYVPFFLKITKHFKRFLWFERFFYNDTIKTEKFTYITLPKHLLKNIRRPLSIILQKNTLKKYKNYDLMHAHFAIWSIEWLIARYMNKRYNIPYVVSVRSTDVKWWIYKNKILDKASKIHLPAKWIKDHIPKKYHHKVITITHGVDILDNSDLQKERTILFVWKLIKSKKADRVIQAYKKYVKPNQWRTLKIIWSGPEEENLRLLANGRNDVQFLWKIPYRKVIQEMEKSQIFSMPSISETFWLVYLEAMSTKNIVIATKWTGIDGLFIDQEEVFYTEPQEKKYEKVFSDIIDNIDKYGVIWENGHKKLIMEYQRDRIVEEYIKLYNKE